MKIWIRVIIGLTMGILLLSCNKTSLNRMEFLFTPAFHHHSQFEIDLDNKSLKYYNYLKDYKGKVYSNKQVKTYSIKTEDLDQFLNQMYSVKLDSTIDYSRKILDGIGFKVCKYLSNSDTVCLTNNSPGRNSNYRNEYILLDGFFQLVNKTITDQEGLSYIENIQDYFDYGLPIKKMADEPLEYKVWGAVAENELVELDGFLNRLPINAPVLFDVSNGSVSENALDVFEKYQSVKQLYFYGFNGYVSLKELKDFEMGKLKQTYKHKEFYGDVNLEKEVEIRIDSNWKTVGNLNAFKTKEELIKSLYLKGVIN